MVQFGAAMKRDEEALVILTIFTDRYPFRLTLSVSLGDVSPAVTCLTAVFHLHLLSFIFLIQRGCTSWEVHTVLLRAAWKGWRVQR